MTQLADDEKLWLRVLAQDSDNPLETVFFPHAGGSAGYFRKLAMSLTKWVDSVAVQYPGRQDRRHEPPVDTIPELADRIAEVLSANPSRPRLFFGHSMGAVLAFEVARLLEGTPPVGLIVSGRRAPSVTRVETLHRDGDDAMITELVKLGGTDAAFLRVPELWEMVAPSIRADYRAIETYRGEPGATVACPVSVFVGDSDPRVSQAEARIWERHTEGDFRLRVVAGGHFYLGEPTAEVHSAIVEEIRWLTARSTSHTGGVR